MQHDSTPPDDIGYSDEEIKKLVQKDIESFSAEDVQAFEENQKRLAELEKQEQAQEKEQKKLENTKPDNTFRIIKRIEDPITGKVSFKHGAPDYDLLLEKFAEEHKAFWVLAESNQVVVYIGNKYEFREDLFLKGWVNNKIKKPSASASEAAEFLARLKMYPGKIIKLSELTKKSERKLNFKNCVLDLATGEILVSSHEWGFFSSLSFDYDKNAKAPLWEKFLLDVTESRPEQVDALEEFFGYAISGDECWAQKALMLIGDGANGKSTMLEAVISAVGPENTSSVSMAGIKNPVSRYSLLGKLFNFSEETNINDFSKSEIFKALVGGAKVEVKKLYSQPSEEYLKAKHIIAANDYPNITDLSRGFMRRFIIIELGVDFTKTTTRDFNILEKLKAERAGIINRLIVAYQRLLKARRFSNQKQSDLITDQLRLDADTVQAFVLDKLTIVAGDSSAFMKSEDLFTHYSFWCQNYNLKQETSTKFFKRFKKISGKDAIIRRLDNGKQVRGYLGIHI